MMIVEGKTRKPPMAEVKKCNVPIYLQKGALFCSFGEENDETISIPSNTLKQDQTVTNEIDLDHLLTSLRFWGVDGLAQEVIGFLLHNKNRKDLIATVEEFEFNFPYLKPFRLLLEQPGTNIVHLAIQCSELDLLKHLDTVQLGLVVSEQHLLAAFKTGHLECFKYVFHKHPPNNQRLVHENFSLVVSEMNYDCFIYSYQQAPARKKGFPRPDALLHNGVASMEYGQRQGLPLRPVLYREIIRMRDFAAFQYLHDAGCPWEENVAELASMSGELQFLQYAHEHGCSWSVDKVGSKAVYYGKLECLKYAHQHGFEVNSYTAALAAAYAQLEVLKYLHEQGCELTLNVCVHAAYDESLPCMRYLRRHLCPWSAAVLSQAVENDQLECVKYLFDEGCPYDEDVKIAARKSKSDCGPYVLAEIERLESDSYMTVSSLFADNNI